MEDQDKESASPMDEEHAGDKKLYCSFCGKHKSEVRKLIAGPSTFICDECVEHCNDILDEELQGKDHRKRPRNFGPAPECSFCGKHGNMIWRIVAGRDACICEKCIYIIEGLQHAEHASRHFDNDLNLSCSFCGKGRSEGHSLIESPEGRYFCDECALWAMSTCVELQHGGAKDSGKGPHCSFCGTAVERVRCMATGSGMYICNKCIYLARFILKQGPRWHLREII